MVTTAGGEQDLRRQVFGSQDDSWQECMNQASGGIVIIRICIPYVQRYLTKAHCYIVHYVSLRYHTAMISGTALTESRLIFGV